MGEGMTLPVGRIIDMLPIECGIMSAITKQAAERDAGADGGAEGSGFFDGDCKATSQSEHTKVSVNLLRNRNNQVVASGVYFYHVETPDGREKIGRFTVVNFAQ